jgi:ATP-dependent 26S proteasome regulatory subunit
MPERTVVLLSGQAAPTLGQAAAIARSLQPSMLVLEDVDLVAMERTMGMGSNPLLFQLLNEMDGLDEDADVIFVLTTNRVELLEPALASRPGRIDQAVEIRLPDAQCRHRLLERYMRGIDLDQVEFDGIVERTEGVSAAFLKELARRAALVAAEATDGATALVVGREHVDQALDDLLEHSAPVLRSSLGANPDAELTSPGPAGGMWATPGGGGFSSSFVSHRSIAFEDYEADDD